jgi:hypothetical protein
MRVSATGRFLAQTFLYRDFGQIPQITQKEIKSTTHTPVSNVHIHKNCIQNGKDGKSRSMYIQGGTAAMVWLLGISDLINDFNGSVYRCGRVQRGGSGGT